MLANVIRSLFSYYGGKHRISASYAAPVHDTIIEPFAGSAGYAHRHHTKNVILIECDPIVAELWRWLIDATDADVLDLPLLEFGEDVRLLGLSRPAETLIGFWCNPGGASPCRTLSAWAKLRPGRTDFWSHHLRARISENIHKINHWKIIEGDYTDAPDIEATWFIDPPYSSRVGRHYKHNQIDYSRLGSWCRSRSGQSIVCEMDGATWLPFSDHCSTNGQKRKTKEVVWMNRQDRVLMDNDVVGTKHCSSCDSCATYSRPGIDL